MLIPPFISFSSHPSIVPLPYYDVNVSDNRSRRSTLLPHCIILCKSTTVSLVMVVVLREYTTGNCGCRLFTGGKNKHHRISLMSVHFRNSMADDDDDDDDGNDDDGS